MENYSQSSEEKPNYTQSNFSEEALEYQQNKNQIQSVSQHSNSESYNPAMHFFLYLVTFLSLCFLSTGIGAVLYQLINKNFTDELLRYDFSNYFSQYAIKYGISTLIIGTPIYFSTMYFANKYIYEGKINENSKVRKWLTYIVLFIATATILGDLILLIYNLLGGDIITRFILKVLVVLFIAGSIFSYYLLDMRRKNMIGQRYTLNKVYTGTSLFIIYCNYFRIYYD